MFRLAPNIELLFTEAGDSHADRVRAAASAGFDAVEMWPSEDKDVPAVRAALDETGVELTSQLAGPRVRFMLDPDHSEFDRGMDAVCSSRTRTAARGWSSAAAQVTPGDPGGASWKTWRTSIAVESTTSKDQA